MKPNPFDHKIKESLSNRTIQPSSQAWDRLDAMLTLQEKPKEKPWKIYFSIAASVVAIAVVLLVQNQGQIDQDTLTPKENPVVIQNEEVKEIQETLETKPNANFPSPTVTNSPKEHFSNQSDLKNTVVQKSQESVSKSEIQEIKALTSEQLKRAQLLLASIEHDSNVENVKTVQITKNTNIAVNGSDLLENVEEEMNQTYREKMVKKVNKNLNSIRDTWVNRNLE